MAMWYTESSFIMCASHTINLALRGSLHFLLVGVVFQRLDISSGGLMLISIVTKGHVTVCLVVELPTFCQVTHDPVTIAKAVMTH